MRDDELGQVELPELKSDDRLPVEVKMFAGIWVFLAVPAICLFILSLVFTDSGGETFNKYGILFVFFGLSSGMLFMQFVWFAWYGEGFFTGWLRLVRSQIGKL